MALTNEMRYGISALGMGYKQNAEKDELLVNQSSGKMFYKRETDGQIVSYDNDTYNQETLAVAMNTAMSLSNTSIAGDANNFVVYHTIDISEKTDLLKTDVYTIDSDSITTVSANEAAFFVRIHGDALTNTIINYLEKTYSPTLGEDISTIKLIFSVKELSTNTESSLVVKTSYNILTVVQIPKIENATGYEIKLISIESLLPLKSYNQQTEAIRNFLVMLNNGNTKFESTTIDIVSYVSDIASSTIYNSEDNIKLQSIMPMALIESISTSSKSEGIIVSEDKPDHKCVWGKIITSN